MSRFRVSAGLRIFDTFAERYVPAVPGTTLTLWPAHEGFDYPYTVDHRGAGAP